MATGNDMKHATATYGGFIAMVKYGTVASIVVVAAVVAIIAS